MMAKVTVADLDPICPKFSIGKLGWGRFAASARCAIEAAQEKKNSHGHGLFFSHVARRSSSVRPRSVFLRLRPFRRKLRSVLFRMMKRSIHPLMFVPSIHATQ